MSYSKKDEKELIEVLKKGNFTVVFNDSNSGSIIYGKRYKDYTKYADDCENGDGDCGFDRIDFDEESYGGELTDILVKALGGRLIST